MVAVISTPRSNWNEDIDELSNILGKETVLDVEIPMRGLLVKESIVVSDYSRNFLEAQSSNISHFCTGSINTPLFIKVRGLSKIVVGRMTDLLAYKGKLRLNDFRILNQSWIDRNCERMQPKQPTYVTLMNGKNQIRANLFDLSRTGAGLFISKAPEEDATEMYDMNIIMVVRIPPRNTTCKIPGKIAQVHNISNELVRLGLTLSPVKADCRILEKYLTERKREILDEAFNNYRELLNYRETKDLYF